MARKVTTKDATDSKAKAAVARTKAPTRKPKAEPAPPAAPPADERDYLVIFEEPDPYGLPADDVLVLDIDTGSHKRPEVDVQQKVKLELTNTTSRLGTLGYIVSLVGGLLGLILMVAFSVIYPDDWYGGANQVSTVRTVILLAVAAVAFMISGTVLTHYGRRIQARSELSDVRIVEKQSSRSANFE